MLRVLPFLITGLLFSTALADEDLPEPDEPLAEPVATIGDIEFRVCERSSHERTRRVECAQLSVPENPAEPDGQQIELDIVRLPARNPRSNTAPVLALSGGPGQAAIESFLILDQMLRDVSRQHDIYLVDQRGTGGSNALHCDLSREEALLMETDADAMGQLAQRCLDELDADPTQYTTSVALADFEAVREALDLPEWQLYGVSYGTRVAQHYLRQQPESIRTAILDGVVPMDMNLGPDIALQSQRALDRVLERCAEDTACADAFPDLQDGLTGLLQALRNDPRTVTVENLHRGELETLDFTDTHLVGLLRLALYQPETIATLPPMLHQAYAEDHFGPLARNAISQTEELSDSLAMGMHHSVICTEDVPFYTLDSAERASIEDTYMGGLVLQAMEATCEVWPAGVLDDGLKDPLASDIPTLLLSGEHDPITPPDYAEQVLPGLSQGVHLVAPGQGHMVSFRGCLPTLVAQFLHDGHADDLDTQCLERLSPTPLMIDFNGPSP